MAHGFLAVVVALHQRFARDVVHAFGLGRIEAYVVAAAAGRVHAAFAHAFDDVAFRHFDLDHVIQRDAGALERVGLRDGARETVEQVAVGAIGLGQAIAHQADDQVVRDQAARVHDLLGFQAQRRAGLDGGAQHVTGGYLRDAVVLGEKGGLGAFAGSGRSEQNETHGGS